MKFDKVGIVGVFFVACLVGCTSYDGVKLQLDESQLKVHSLEAENQALRLDLNGHQSMACRFVNAAIDTTESAYLAAKPVVIKASQDATTWVKKEYNEHR